MGDAARVGILRAMDRPKQRELDMGLCTRSRPDYAELTMRDPIKVMLVDDSPGTLDMLREALSMDSAIQVVGGAASGSEAIGLARDLHPNVVLMDIRIPNGNGASAARTILAEDPSIKIVALTWLDEPASVRDMLSAGAIGYVVKGGPIDGLFETIHRVAAGEADLDHRILATAVEDLHRLLEEERDRRAQAERLAQAREEFVQVLSHELRTPLTVISGALAMLERSDVQPEESALVRSALHRARELEFVVEGLELVAPAPAGEGAAVCQDTLSAATKRLGRGPDHAALDAEQWAGVPQRYLDRVMFELLSNALRHGQRPVEVTGRHAGREATLTVGDAGGWAPPGGRIEAFLQGDMSATRTERGFGLGLFIASRLCQATGGDL